MTKGRSYFISYFIVFEHFSPELFTLIFVFFKRPSQSSPNPFQSSLKKKFVLLSFFFSFFAHPFPDQGSDPSYSCNLSYSNTGSITHFVGAGENTHPSTPKPTPVPLYHSGNSCASNSYYSFIVSFFFPF